MRKWLLHGQALHQYITGRNSIYCLRSVKFFKVSRTYLPFAAIATLSLHRYCQLIHSSTRLSTEHWSEDISRTSEFFLYYEPSLDYESLPESLQVILIWRNRACIFLFVPDFCQKAALGMIREAVTLIFRMEFLNHKTFSWSRSVAAPLKRMYWNFFLVSRRVFGKCICKSQSIIDLECSISCCTTHTPGSWWVCRFSNHHFVLTHHTHASAPDRSLNTKSRYWLKSFIMKTFNFEWLLVVSGNLRRESAMMDVTKGSEDIGTGPRYQLIQYNHSEWASWRWISLML